MKRIRLTGIAPWARDGGWRGAFGALAAISLRVEPIPMPQLDPVVTFLSCTRRTLLVLGAALPAFLRPVVAALKGCTPSRSAVCLFALVLFLPSSTAAQAQTAPEITSGGPFTVAEGAVDEAQTVVRGPYLQSGTSSSVIIKWRTDEATDSVVRYGLDPDSLTLLASDSESTTEHAVQLTGLSADVKYFYSVGTSSALHAGRRRPRSLRRHRSRPRHGEADANLGHRRFRNRQRECQSRPGLLSRLHGLTRPGPLDHVGRQRL